MNRIDRMFEAMLEITEDRVLKTAEGKRIGLVATRCPAEPLLDATFALASRPETITCWTVGNYCIEAFK